MFRSIIDHRQLQVVHYEFEFHLQCELASYNVNLRYYVITLPLEFKLLGNVTIRLK